MIVWYDVYQYFVLLADMTLFLVFLTPKKGYVKTIGIYLPISAAVYTAVFLFPDAGILIAVFFLTVFILIHFLFSESFKQKIQTFIFYLLAVGLSELVIGALFWGGNEDRLKTVAALCLFVRVLFLSASFSAIKKIRNIPLQKNRIYFLIYLLVYMLFGFVFYQLLHVGFENMPYAEQSLLGLQLDNWTRVLFFVSFFLSTAIMVLSANGLAANAEKAELQIKKELLADKEELDYLYFSECREEAQKAESIKIRMMQLLEEMQNTGELAQMQERMRELSDSVAQIKKYDYCCNDVVNSILAVKEIACRKNGIALAVDMHVPAVLPFSDTDICRLLGNMADNAMQAAEKLPPTRKKSVRVGICYSEADNAYYFSTINPLADGVAVDANSKTTKKNKKLHGFGMAVIKDITKKYHGHFTMDTANGFCRVVVMLKLPKAAKADRMVKKS